MSSTKSAIGITLLLSAFALPTLFSAEQKSDSEQPGAESQSSETKPRGRLPNHFGKLGISEEQRTRIYSIQADYDERIDELLSQIEELVTTRDADIDAVLTEGQRARLRELRSEARNRRDGNSDQTSQQPSEQE